MSEQINFPHLLFFGSLECGPSNANWPIVKQAVRDAKGHVDLTYVNVLEQPQEAKKYKIEGTPTLVMLNKRGGETERLAGYNYKEILDMMLTRSLV